MSDRFETDKKVLTLNAGESVRVGDRLNVRLTSTSSTAPPLKAYTLSLGAENSSVQLGLSKSGYEITRDGSELTLDDALDHVNESLAAGGVNQPSRAAITMVAEGPDDGPYPVNGTVTLRRDGVVVAEDTFTILEPEE